MHEGTRYTPYELVFGCPARSPTTQPREEDEDTIYKDYLSELMTRIHQTQTLARGNLINAKEKSKRYYDTKVNEKLFQARDLVYLQVWRKKSKFREHYTGPHKIIEVIPDGNLKIKIGRKMKVVHQNRLAYSYINKSEEAD